MEWLKKIVDNALADMAKKKVLMTTPRNVPAEMLDESMTTIAEGLERLETH